MAPLPTPSSTSPRSRSSTRRGVNHAAAAAAPPQRSSSFHGAGMGSSEQKQTTLRRPRTQPELLGAAAWRKTLTSSPSPSPLCHDNQMERRVPSKVLVNVNVQRSLGALQVMASTEWTVGDLVAAAVKQYVKELRRPLLPSADPSLYGLHYSQFSLECLDPKEKLIGLGSRNFFLCPKSTSALALSPSSSSSASANEATAASAAAASCSKQEAASKITIPWLRSILKSLPSA